MENGESQGKLDGWEKWAKAVGWKSLHKKYNIICASKLLTLSTIHDSWNYQLLKS